MFIEVGENTYELHAKLGISIMIEKKFKQPLVKIFDNLEEAEIPEMITILGIAAKKLGKNDEFKDFENDLLENWDYTDLQLAVSDLIINLMFSGTPEQIEKKLEKFPGDEQQKNAFREALGLPKKEVVSTENSLYEQPTE